MKSIWLPLMVWLWVFASAQTPATGVISGRVTDDNGEPVINAMVWVSSKGIKQSGPQRFANTDEEGRFEIRVLSAQAYGLSAAAPGYVSDENDTATYFLGSEATLSLVKGGVITGRVTDAAGKPVVALNIQAQRVRDGNGRAFTDNRRRVAKTDDRGIYRIFGLPAGSYLVMTNDDARPNYRASAYDADAPLYYPTATRDTAVEVSVQLGGENSGIDLQYRSQPGRIVSGKVSGALPNSGFNVAQINMRHWPSGTVLPNVYATNRSGTLAYEFAAVADGEYEIQAVSYENDSFDGAQSAPRRITVKGGDLTGIDLTLNSFAQLAGKVVLVQPPDLPDQDDKSTCRVKRPLALSEVLLTAPRVPQSANDAARIAEQTAVAQAVNAKGEWRLRGLEAGRYRFTIPWPSEDWYLKSITAPPVTKPETDKTPQPVSLPLALNAGEKRSDLIFTLSAGAASIQGHVALERTEKRKFMVHLIPVISEADALAYAETEVASDGKFALSNLAPGKYWLLALPIKEGMSGGFTFSLALDAATRKQLRKDAELAAVTFEALPCSHTKDFKLEWKK